MVVLDPAFEPTLSVYSVNRNALRVRLYAVEPERLAALPEVPPRLRDHDGKLTQPPGTLVATRNVEPKKAADELVETRIDLAPALKDGFGQVIAIVEPPVQKPKKNRVGGTRARMGAQLGPGHQARPASLLRSHDVLRLGESALRRRSGRATPRSAILPPPDASSKRSRRRWSSARPALTASRAFRPAKSGGIVFARKRRRRRVPARRAADHSFAAHAALRPTCCWFVFDDRHLYKPGERVNVKGWLRVATAREARATSRGSRPARNRVSIHSERRARQQDRRRQAPTSIPTAASTSAFDLPKNANLGQGNLRLAARRPCRACCPANEYGHAYRIEEFRRPEFEVSAETTEGPHFVGKHAIATVTASYYAGGALPDSEVKWRVQADDAFFAPPNRTRLPLRQTAALFVVGVAVRATTRTKGRPTRPGSAHASRRPAPAANRLRCARARPTRASSTLEASVTDVNRQTWTARASTSSCTRRASRWASARRARCRRPVRTCRSTCSPPTSRARRLPGRRSP